MKNFRTLVVVVVVCMFFACGVDRDLVPDQRKAIEGYLSSKKVESYEFDGGTYWFTANASREFYETNPVAEPGDSLYYYFEEYIFNGGPAVPCIFSNKSSVFVKDTILNRRFWSFDPVGVKVGSTKMIDGLALALPYCRQNDSLVVLMTTEAAYGHKAVGLIPQDSPVMMMLTIQTVKKQ